MLWEREDKKQMRKAILEATKTPPKNPTEIRNYLLKEYIKLKIKKAEITQPHKIVQNYINDFVESGLIFKIENSSEGKELLLGKYHKLWGVSKREFSAYYINTEKSGAENLKKIFDVFLIRFGEFIEDKEKIRKKVIGICKLLSEFEALNDFSKDRSWKIYKHKHLKDGSIKKVKIKQPIRILTFRERKIQESFIELLVLQRKKRKKKLTKKEQDRYNELKNLKEENFIFENIADEQLTKIQNKIYKRFEKIDGSPEMYGLLGDITRELKKLINSLYREINLITILNKITKDMNLISL